VSYLPGDSDSGMFGVFELARAHLDAGQHAHPPGAASILPVLREFIHDRMPDGSGKRLNLCEVAKEIGRRLTSIFQKDGQGKRPVHGTASTFQEDPYWRDYALFYEYFHGDTGAGVGASHQTGWTGAIARIMHLFASVGAENMLQQSKDTSAGDPHRRRSHAVDG